MRTELKPDRNRPRASLIAPCLIFHQVRRPGLPVPAEPIETGRMRALGHCLPGFMKSGGATAGAFWPSDRRSARSID